MNEEKKEDEIEPLGESKNNMEEVVSKKKKKKMKKNIYKVKSTPQNTKNQINKKIPFIQIILKKKMSQSKKKIPKIKK